MGGGMGMMGMGGLLAAIGGLCFLIIAISALRSERAPSPVVPLLEQPLTAGSSPQGIR